MKKNEIGILAAIAVVIVIAAFGVATLVPAVSAVNPPQEDGKGPYRDYVMKVAPIEQTVVTEGTLFVKLQCGHNLITKEFTVQKLKLINPGFAVNNGPVAEGQVETNFEKVGGERTFAIRPDGTFDVQMPPGIYAARIADGNGAQPETVVFTIKPAYSTLITFFGHGVTPADVPKPATVVITKATYGAYVTVIDQQAYDELIPAVTHQDYEAGHVHAKKVGSHSPHDFYYAGDKYQIVQNNEHYDAFHYLGYFSTHPAQVVTIVDVPAHTVHHAAVTHTEGSFIDVTAQVQAVLDAGFTEFVFNNAAHPGGIFAGGALQQAITDPAVGIVKDVTIEYNGITVNAHEYETITIG